MAKKKKRQLMSVDVETYRNYFLVVLKSQKGDIRYFEMFNNAITDRSMDLDSLRGCLKNSIVLTFNGNNYDLPIIAGALNNYTNQQLKKLSDDIIVEKMMPWELAEAHPKVLVPAVDHIDLVGVTPLQASLKTYGCRIHTRSLQDLPVHPDATITQEQADILLAYCINDVEVSFEIYNTLKGDVDLRIEMGKEYGQDFRSKSGPQIAEAVLKTRLIEKGEHVSKRESAVEPFHYKVPEFIKFESPELKALLEAVREAVFEVNGNGYVQLPEALDKAVEFRGAKYKMGIGGLHSQEKNQAIIAAEHERLGELDVASMYPSIILGQGLFPDHLGDTFCDVYREIFDQRIEAKKSGDKIVSDSLKLVLNSSYGKFGNRYSFLYSPELLIQTTITGQLALFMLIERMSEIGTVVSANTDGVVVLFDESQQAACDAIAEQWTAETTYVLEWTPYSALYSESVNSYIALKPSGGAKRKGLFAEASIAKGYANQICIDAVVEYLEFDVPVEETIYTASDMTKFLTMRGVRGGAKWRGQELGKVVRWYVSTQGEEIRYIKNDNKVAGSDGAVPLMVLDGSFMRDIDYDYYIHTAKKMLKRLGVKDDLG